MRGEVYSVNLEPTIGGEIQKVRPCLIVSPDVLNKHLNTVQIVPLTTGAYLTKFRVPIHFKGKKGLACPEQIRTIDKMRLLNLNGKIDDSSLEQVLSILRDMFEV